MVKNLRKLRLSKGISQQQLADVIGTTQQSINKYENHSTEPDIDTLVKLADYFEISIDYLVGHTSSKNASPMEELTLTHKEIVFLKDFRKLSKKEQTSLYLITENYLAGK